MNPNFWSRAPLVRILLPFAIGILLCNYYSGISVPVYLLLAGIFLALYLLSFYRKVRLHAAFPVVFMSFFCLFVGMAASQQSKLHLRHDFFAKSLNDSSLLLVRIYEPLQEKENSYKAIAEVEAVINQQIIPASGRLILYFNRQNLTRLPKYGEKIIIANTVKPLQKPLSPEVFDYAKFMSYKQIYHSAYLQTSHYQFTNIAETSFFWQAIYAFKNKLLATLDYYIQGQDERGIAKALILGDETDVLPHITASYAGTGTLHVLSVSGLHVGLIFIGLNFFLASLNYTPSGRFARAAILVVALLFYGILTGLSASVLRSVIMFCFVVIGLNFRSVTNIYNSMAFSALGLLVFDPFLLMQLGFQLSYLALLGIVWLHPHIAKLWQPENKKLVWMRDVLAMSLAAQLATFPLGLYYFNQFPAYFLLSNLIVIPWSSIALGAGCIFLIVSQLPLPEFLIAWAGKLLYWLIFGLNKVVDFLSALPYAQWEGIYISIFECLLIYLAMALLLFAFIHQHKYLLHTGLAAVILIFCSRSIHKFSKLEEDRFTVHAIPKTSLVSIKEGNKMFLLGDSAFINNPDQWKFHVNRYAYSLFVPKPYIQSPENASVFKSSTFYFSSPVGQAGKLSFLWLKHKNDIPVSGMSGQHFDFIILSRNIKIRLRELAQKMNFNKVILTADNSFYRNAGWEKECEELGISCINLQKDNSFVLNY